MFRLCDDFDVCYYDEKFIVKSKNYKFSTTQVMGCELLLSLLKSHNYRGVVLFDLLLSNGLHAENRFIECYFNGESFNWKELKVFTVSQYSIHNEYYQNKNNVDIRYGILTKEEIKEILKAKVRNKSTNMSKDELNKIVKTTRIVAKRSSHETDKKLFS